MGKKVIVVGAGAAGLMAGGKAAERGREVTILEKNDTIAKKILISGKGRCNITNNTDIEGLIENTPGNGNFLYSAFYIFSNADIVDFFEGNGLKTKVERGGRIFPESDNAKDVVEALKRYVIKNNAKLELKSAVEEIIAEDGRVTGVALKDGRIITGDAVILATGGASYPGTGSTGDGFRMAKKLGHTITELKPSLVPLIAEEAWVKKLQGLSLKNISIEIVNNYGKKLYSDFGEMLFTHYGVSGPVILSGSRHILKQNYRDVKLIIDLKPALSEEKLDERIQRDFGKYARKQLKNAMDDLLPKKLIPVIIELSGISPEKFVNQITREERKKLVNQLKRLCITIAGARPIEEAIVTAGGVKVDEINPSTMESKLIKGLFLAGEVIDVDAYTGGFNLTIAFSTGYLAGMNC
ncbi:MAG: NAD(P)/FAD-dependent oxidoreductase [Clostridia bacterium]|nr:NAD(P)/FAD-dependent oxidoreductase [Clostridia bacterium]